MNATFKKGSTFTATIYYVPGPTDPVDLSSTTVTSSVMVDDGKGTTYAGTVTKAGDNLSLTVVIASAVTNLWPAATALWDAKFVYAGNTFYSATEFIDCESNVTP